MYFHNYLLAGFSGGKDSTVALIRALELGYNVDLIFHLKWVDNTLPILEFLLKKTIRLIDRYFPRVYKRFKIIDVYVEYSTIGKKYTFLEYLSRYGYPFYHRLWCWKYKWLALYYYIVRELHTSPENICVVMGVKVSDGYAPRKKYMKKYLELIEKEGLKPIKMQRFCRTDTRIFKWYILPTIANWSTDQVWSYLKQNYPNIYDWLAYDFYIGGVDGYNPSNCIICPNHGSKQLRILCRLGYGKFLRCVLERCLEKEKTQIVKKHIQHQLRILKSLE